ncbi:MAG: hypothetical protein HY928_11535 [Elusimicrobia bacterium]|nr:hypothetical protein [Elusimicrobiota bacterium]
MAGLALLATLLTAAPAAWTASPLGTGQSSLTEEESPRDPGQPTEALKVFEAKPDPEEKKHQEQANPDPVHTSVLPLMAGAGALVLPFLGWFALRKFKGD